MSEARVATFQEYREYVERLPFQSLSPDGIWDGDAYRAVTSDPRTIWVPSEADWRIPIAASIDNLPYVVRRFYEREAGVHNLPVYHYTHLKLLAPDEQQYRMAVRGLISELADDQGLLIYDYPDFRTGIDDEVREIIKELGDVACRELRPDSMPRHYHYVSAAGKPDGIDRQLQPLVFHDLYSKAIAAGDIVADGPVRVEPTLSEADADEVWEFYGPAHERLNDNDPLAAGFTRDELRFVFAAPEYAKVVYRHAVTGRILNISFVASINDCPWLNKHYFMLHYPEAYDAGRIICGIGAITDPAQADFAATVRTLAMVSQLTRRAGGQAVLAFACDDTSNRYAPAIARRAWRASGMGVSFAVPVGQQIFRALQLTRSR